MATATRLLSSLFNVTLSVDVPFLQAVAAPMFAHHFSTRTFLKPGAGPQPTIGGLWVCARFTEIAL